MALKRVWIGSQGPFLFDDSETYEGEVITYVGLRTETIIEVANVQTSNLSTNVRLTYSDSNKEIQEVNNLASWISGDTDIKVSDDGDGTITIKIDQLEVEVDNTDSPYSVTKETVVLADCTGGDVDINLPAVANAESHELIIKRYDASANNVNVNTNGSETIDGQSSLTLVNQYDFVRLFPGVSEWLIIG